MKKMDFGNIGRGKHGHLAVKELKCTDWFLRKQEQDLPEQYWVDAVGWCLYKLERVDTKSK